MLTIICTVVSVLTIAVILALLGHLYWYEFVFLPKIKEFEEETGIRLDDITTWREEK